MKEATTTTVKQHIDQASADDVKSVILDLLEKMGVIGELSTRIQAGDYENEMLHINIESNDSHFLIGQNGVNLVSFQHIARLLYKRKVTESVHFVIDVNNYRKNRETYLKKLAQELAQKAKTSGEKIILKPLSAYERRIIHMTLAEEEGIVTESIGQEPERRLVIKLESDNSDDNR